MDVVEAMELWSELGHPIRPGFTDENGNYIIPFIDKDGVEQGRITAYPGQGIGWNLPDQLFREFYS